MLHTLKFTDDGPLADVNCDYIIDEPGPFLFERSAEGTAYGISDSSYLPNRVSLLL